MKRPRPLDLRLPVFGWSAGSRLIIGVGGLGTLAYYMWFRQSTDEAVKILREEEQRMVQRVQAMRNAERVARGSSTGALMHDLNREKAAPSGAPASKTS
jgi:hypothetical protein